MTAESYAPTSGAHRPGHLITAERMKAYLVPRVRMPARAWKIRYSSTTATGRPTTVTGMVLVPPTPYAGPRPLIGYGIGTQGLSKYSAPSRQIALGIEYEASVIASALRRGWAIALTDYPGLGTPGDHPYVIGRALGPAVLDCMRAARQLTEAQLDPDGPLAIFGYSEGGNAAGWALQLQPTYAPDLPIVAGAVGAAPADLEASALDGSLFAFLLIYGIFGLNAAYPEIDVYQYLNRRGHRAVARFGRTHISRAVPLGAAMSSKRLLDHVTQSPYEIPEVLARLQDNRLGSIAPKAPVLIGAGTHDQVIPYSQARNLFREWRDGGADVHLRTMPIREHITGGISFAPAAFAFLARHLVQAGRR